MLRVWIHRIKPECEPRLRTWLAELDTRADEVRTSFAVSGTRAEQAYIVPGAEGSLLVYASEADNHDAAATVFANSALPIDRDHHAVMRECVEDIEATPVYSLST